MVFTSHGLPPLPPGKVYQLWFIGPPTVRSAGLLPAAQAGQAGPVLASGLVRGDEIGLTVEPAGGTRKPTTTPILIIKLRA
jgi:anti-sigma-K factor RskA